MKNKENIFELDKFAPYLQHVKRKNKTKMILFKYHIIFNIHIKVLFGPFIIQNF